MSLLAVAEKDLADIETSAVSAAKTLLNYIDNIFVTDIEPALAAAIKDALAVFSQDALAAILGTATSNAAAAAPSAPQDPPTAA